MGPSEQEATMAAIILIVLALVILCVVKRASLDESK